MAETGCLVWPGALTLPRHDGLAVSGWQQPRQAVDGGLLDRGGQGEDRHQQQHQAVGLLSGQHLRPDQHEEGEEDREGHQVTKHHPGLQAERLYDHVVEEDSYERCQDVDQADIEDDCCARENVLEEIHGGHKAVVGKEETNTRHQQDNVDSVILESDLIKWRMEYAMGRTM